MPNDVRCCDYRAIAEINAVSAEWPFEWGDIDDADRINSQILVEAL